MYDNGLTKSWATLFYFCLHMCVWEKLCVIFDNINFIFCTLHLDPVICVSVFCFIIFSSLFGVWDMNRSVLGLPGDLVIGFLLTLNPLELCWSLSHLFQSSRQSCWGFWSVDWLVVLDFILEHFWIACFCCL